MKKTTLIILLLISAAITSFAQSKKDTTKNVADTSALTIDRKTAIDYYNAIAIALKGLPTSTSISAADATFSLGALNELAKKITNKYANKNPVINSIKKQTTANQ